MAELRPRTVGISAVDVPARDGSTLPCKWCNAPVPQRATGPGRRRRYCAPPKTCKEEAKRDRAARRAAGVVGTDVATAEDLVDRLQIYVDRLVDAAGIRRSAAEDVARARSARDEATAEAEKFRVIAVDAENAAREERTARIDAERRAARAIAERDAAARAAQAAEARAMAAEHAWCTEAGAVDRATSERDTAMQARDSALTQAPAAARRANPTTEALRLAEETARAALAALRTVEAERDRLAADLAATRAELDTALPVPATPRSGSS